MLSSSTRNGIEPLAYGQPLTLFVSLLKTRII